MCFEILVHDVIPSQRWPQKPPPLGTNERCRVARGAKPRSLPLKTELPEGTVTQDSPQCGGRAEGSFIRGSEEARGWGLILLAPQTIYPVSGGLRKVPKARQQQEKSRKILGESGERPLLREEEAALACGDPQTLVQREEAGAAGGDVRSRCRSAPRQRRGAGGLAHLRPPSGSSSLQAKRGCGFSFTRASRAPAQPRRDRGGRRRQPEPEAEARAASRAVQSSRLESPERKILFKICECFSVLRTEGSED